MKTLRFWPLVGLTLLWSGSAWAQKGMWGYSIHVCTEAGKCTEGVMNKSDAPIFVSKAKCEDGAQEMINGLRRIGMVIKYVRCVQL